MPQVATPSCDDCAFPVCDQIELLTCVDSGIVDELRSPVTEWVPRVADIYHAEQTSVDRDRLDRDEVVEHWKFWVSPTVEPDPRGRILWCEMCFDIEAVTPLIMACGCSKTLHHYEVTAKKATG